MIISHKKKTFDDHQKLTPKKLFCPFQRQPPTTDAPRPFFLLFEKFFFCVRERK